jgi:hypothetical protein
MRSILLRLCFFASAVCLGLVGGFLALDAFIPKEKSVSMWALIVEFTIGVMFVGLGICLARKNRLSPKTNVHRTE